MSSNPHEDKLIHIDAITHQMFSTVLEIGSNESTETQGSELDKKVLHNLSRKLSDIKDSLEIAYVVKDTLLNVPFFTSFLIVEIDSLNKTFGTLLSGGKNVEPVRYKLKGKPGFPLHDEYFDAFLAENEPTEHLLSDFASSPWISKNLNNWKQAGFKKVLICGIRTSKEFNGLLFLFSASEAPSFKPYFRLVQGIAEQISAAFICFRTVEKMKNMECQYEVGVMHRLNAEREKEKTTLIEISNDMSAIRDKNDLLAVLHSRLKKLFHFSHTLTSLTDLKTNTYTGLIFDSESISKKKHPEYQRICDARYSINDPVMTAVFAASDTAVVFDLDELCMNDECPEWVTMNYDCGIREIVVTILNSGSNHIGSFVILSEKKNSFQSKELGLIKGISSTLANALDNILSKEEILEREKEKSVLLSLSQDVALIRNKEDLLKFNKEKLKKIIPISHLLIFKMTNDESRYTPYLLDPDSVCRSHPEYEKITSNPIPISDWVSDKVFLSDSTQVFDLAELTKTTNLPDYLRMNYECGKKQVIYNALSIGHKKTGLLVMFSDLEKGMDKNQLRLTQGISSQLSTAVTNIIANEEIEKQFNEITDYKLQLENMNDYLQEEIQTSYNYSEIIGNSIEMNKIFHMVSQVADSQSSVLILGETGTGKELIARAIHNASPRKDKAMVKVNCATLPVNLIESELFGHERGSFTGATERRIGKFELANNSTLFLDEIGELPLELQVKLLRALQEKEIERVGGKTVIKTNVRIIAATNRDLQKDVKEGAFRADLFFRINIFPITLPSLRDRKEDIPMLATYFLEKYGRKGNKEAMSFSNKVMKELVAYSWPGNVRELEHLVERSVLLTTGTTIKHISLPITNRKEMEEILPDTAIRTIEEVERDHIIMVLRKTNGKISGIGGAAELLKIPPTTLSSKMAKYKIKKSAIV
ncbi:sigma-54 interaction domain-containing protein [Mucilaginibacter sp.]|jgi:transcriptional regulator with GAF, ATPase, and Fis domain|uniref:sigma-54 interaction domain-containing protein n=1 Tax=Mucilaginibacter sp. TaxID=1882438 RepID=UPI00356464CF